MKTTDDVEKQAKRNPKVNVRQVREAQEMLEELRKAGIGKPQYEIEPPYGSRPPRVRASELDEPRSPR